MLSVFVDLGSYQRFRPRLIMSPVIYPGTYPVRLLAAVHEVLAADVLDLGRHRQEDVRGRPLGHRLAEEFGVRHVDGAGDSPGCEWMCM